jgi:stringent starvation protein B
MAPSPSKKEVLLNLLEKTSVLLHLDARQETVLVPKHLKANPQLILQLGLNLAVPIRDLDVGEEDVRCTLSFSRSPFYCVIPYRAVFAMVSEDGGRAMVWPEDVPPEVARAAEAEARKLGLLEAVPSPAGDAEAAAAPQKPERPTESERPPRSKRELPPYLRVIK